MAKWPQTISVNEENLAQLTSFYKRAYKEIVSEIETATDFGKSNRRAILSQIDNILTQLGEDTQKFLESELPDYYKTGANQAIQQLRVIDAQVRVATGFSQVHKSAILALIDDTSRAFGESMSGVKRSANLLLNKAVKEEITFRLAAGTVKGEALRKTRQTIKGILQEQGLSALKDKAGHTWELDRYAEMLIRTKAVEARNTGLVNRMVENDYDLVQVSSHGADDVCGDWEGEILSLTGKTPDYPTVSDAEADGLFHPNCKHALNVINIELAEKTMGWNPDTQQYEKGLIL